jgi:uncharacterized membrane protein YcfT
MADASTNPATDTTLGANGRVAWVDTAKGICIILVVMMHAVAGYQIAVGAEGWMQPVLDFAQPFRMPDFFLLSALLLYARINAPWKLYVDRKVVHFAYFYVLWMVIQVGIKKGLDGTAPTEILGQMALSLVQPFGTLWFIYLLVVFFLFTRLVRGLPALPVWVMAAVLHLAPINTGIILIDNFTTFFVFFYTGHVLSAHFFQLAESVSRRALASWAAVAAWAIFNGICVWLGWATFPGMTLLLGLAGCAAIIAFAALVATSLPGRMLSVAGAHSIAIYLAFFLPMAAMRIVLAKTGLIADVGLASFVVMTVAVLAPLALFVIVRSTPLKFLFERPDWARIVPPGPPKERPASPGFTAPTVFADR